MSKRNLRCEVQHRLEGMPSAEVAARSEAAAELLASLEEFKQAKVLMLFLSIAGEIDCAPVARAAWSAGKQVLAPTACDNCRKMRPILCQPENAEIFDITHGLRQPALREMEVPIDQIDLVIVPGLAFDRNRNRLGRGGGFYDRFLSSPELRAKKIALAFDVQVVNNVPVDPYDQPVDMIVTDKEII